MRLLAVLLSFQIKIVEKRGVEVLRSRYFFLLLSGAVLLFFGISRARQMQAEIDPQKASNHPECIRCGECIVKCLKSAIEAKFCFRAEDTQTAKEPALSA